jgi:hypothetical protein
VSHSVSCGSDFNYKPLDDFSQVFVIQGLTESGRLDLNQRPLGPEFGPARAEKPL